MRISRRSKRAFIWSGVCLMGVIVLMGLVFLGFSLYAYSTSQSYQSRVEISLNAALLSDSLYILDASGEWEPMDYEGFLKLRYYLTVGAVVATNDGNQDGESFEFLLGEDPVRIVRAYEDDSKAIVYFETDGHSYRMRVNHNAYWRDLHRYFDEGSSLRLQEPGEEVEL